MSVMVTGGRTRVNAAKIYDRLRKRSLRSLGQRRFLEITGRTMTTAPSATWVDTDHMAYVAGVRDALNAISSASQDA